MHVDRAWWAWLAGGTAVAGALASLVLAPGSRDPLDDLAIATVIVAYAVVGVILTLARPANRVGQVMLVGAAAWGVGEALLAAGIDGLRAASDSAIHAGLAVVGTSTRGFGWLVLVLVLPAVFPDGRAESRTALRLGLTSVIVFPLAALLSPVPLEERLAETSNPLGLPMAWAVLTDVLALGALALALVSLGFAVHALARRWRRGDQLQRQQVVVFAVAFALPLVLFPLAGTTWVEPWMFAVTALPAPVAVAVAVLQRRLYDISFALNKTLTYLALSAVLAALYALVIVGVGIVLRDRGAPWLSLVAAAVVAVAFAPAREWLQGVVNRLTYGRWAAPAEVLGETGRRLADAADAPSLLEDLTRELVEGLGLRPCRSGTAPTGCSPAAASRRPSTDQLPLHAYGEPVGILSWSGRPLRGSERELLADLARQIGGVVHAGAVLDDLRQARQQLVLAREQERRRLRHDLHDGLGPALAGMGLQVDTVQALLAAGRSPDQRLEALRRGLADTVVEVRRIVEGLRPPAIDELGLFGAVSALGRQLTEGAALVVDVDLPPEPLVLPAAVEVAAYRVAQEALTNVVRHAGATSCRVTASVTSTRLVLEVRDDGAGGAEDLVASNGVGLRSMRERAHQIGGRVDVRSGGRGTCVTLTLPLGATA